MLLSLCWAFLAYTYCGIAPCLLYHNILIDIIIEEHICQCCCKARNPSSFFYPNSCDYFSAFSGGAGWRTAKQVMYHVYLGTNTKTKLLSTRTTTFVFKEKKCSIFIYVILTFHHERHLVKWKVFSFESISRKSYGCQNKSLRALSSGIRIGSEKLAGETRELLMRLFIKLF